MLIFRSFCTVPSTSACWWASRAQQFQLDLHTYELDEHHSADVAHADATGSKRKRWKNRTEQQEAVHKLAQLRYRSASMLTGPVSSAGLLQSAKPRDSAAGCICASSIRQQPAYIQGELITPTARSAREKKKAKVVDLQQSAQQLQDQTAELAQLQVQSGICRLPAYAVMGLESGLVAERLTGQGSTSPTMQHCSS